MSSEPTRNDSMVSDCAESASIPDVVVPRVVEGVAHNGKPCRLIDNTGTVAIEELQSLLNELIAGRHFGLRARSALGSQTIRLGDPEFTHLQLGEQMYRLLVFSYEAHLEAF